DDHIDLGHDLGNLFAGLVHVTGEPVDGHIRYSLWGLRARAWNNRRSVAGIERRGRILPAAGPF
ncbi:MAG: hypothetical protein ACRC91_21360, partial [Aeromonas sp.]